MAPHKMEEEVVVAGSYDRFLFGFQCSTSTSALDKTKTPNLRREFAYPAHKGPIKCVAAAAPYVATGGADDLIHLYDLKAGADLGFLINPGEGAVSALAFYAPSAEQAPSHLLSGAADGSITIWQAGREWICLKTLRSHKKEVSSISVHPSGRLALSTSRDGALRLWNLVKGKCAHSLALGGVAEQVAFSTSGDQYAMILGSEILVYSIGDEKPRLRLQHQRQPKCLAFAGEDMLLSGAEDGALSIWDTRADGSPAAVVARAHSTRIRAVAPLLYNSGEGGLSPRLVASASSDGVVRVWDFRQLLQADGEKPPAPAKPRRADPQRAAAPKEVDKVPSAGRAETLPKRKKKRVEEGQARKKPSLAAVQRGIARNGVVEFLQEPVKLLRSGGKSRQTKLSKSQKQNGTKADVNVAAKSRRSKR